MKPIFCALGALALPVAASAQSFDYPDFSSVAGLNQVLTTAQLGNVLRVHDITAMGGDNMGAVWYATPVNVAGGFDTTFEFQITGIGGGDGMAFVIQNDTVAGYNGMVGNMGIGRHASALGYGNFVSSLAGEGLENSVAIELDHFMNGNQPAADPILDPDGNHISIHTAGALENEQQESYSIGRATDAMLGADLNSGQVHSVRVRYVPGTLEVFFNGNLVITAPYDFATGGTWIDSNTAVGGVNLIGGTSAYVGFTASSGGALAAHDLISWRFDEGGSLGGNYCGPAPLNSSGNSAQISGSSSQASGSGLHLELSGGPSGELGYFLIGTGANPAPTIPLGNGLLCLTVGGGNSIGRYNVAGSQFNSLGRFDNGGVMQNLVGTSTSGSGFDVPSTIPIAGSPVITAGSTWHFQGWYRDTGAGVGQSNASDGLTVVF